MADKFYLKAEVLETPSFNKKIKEGKRNPFDSTDSIKVCSYHFARRKADEIMLTSWDLVVIDEAHYLRNVYKPRNVTAKEIQRATRDYNKVLLTATPLQNRLEELYGLVSFIDPDLFGDIKAFRKKYVLESGIQDIAALKERLKDIVHRTLRRDVKDFINFSERISITQEFQPSPKEIELYESVLDYLRRDDTYAFPLAQKHLMHSVIFKLLGSSSFAVGRTLEALVRRLEKLLENSKVVDDELYEMFLEEYENLDDEIDEIEEDEDEEVNEITFEDKLAIEDEIKQLESFLLLANSIEHNEKGEKLIMALDTGFEKLEELRANKKALIFTESTRTQKYLFDRLSKEKYAGRILLFNGSNNDDVSKEIYQAWKEDEQNIDKITGSRSVDMRHALVDAFASDDFDIMIATEAASEGINLQFCSMVVNYDLPWNPQRVEQRIGRCHRYGQRFDVVVINFLNTRNHADQRVLELLTEKFNLFSGVFGASDEILGRIESNIDFEKRVLSIYNTCRQPEEIENAFNALQKELEDAITDRILDTQSQLLEHFDEDVHDRLKLRLAEAQSRLDRVGRWLWGATRYALQQHATFDDDAYAFSLNASPVAAPTGRYQLIRGAAQPDLLAHAYRLNHPLGEWVLQQSLEAPTPSASLVFDYERYHARISVIEDLRGTSGWLALSHVEATSFDTTEALIFSAITDAGEALDQEFCEKLMSIPAQKTPHKATNSPPALLQANNERAVKAWLSRAFEANQRLFHEERDKLDRWADDKLLAAELALKNTKDRLRQRKRDARNAPTLQEQEGSQREIAELERLQRQQRREIFNVEDQIIEQRDALIDSLQERMQESSRITPLFTLRWQLV